MRRRRFRRRQTRECWKHVGGRAAGSGFHRLGIRNLCTCTSLIMRLRRNFPHAPLTACVNKSLLPMPVHSCQCLRLLAMPVRSRQRLGLLAMPVLFSQYFSILAIAHNTCSPSTISCSSLACLRLLAMPVHSHQFPVHPCMPCCPFLPFSEAHTPRMSMLAISLLPCLSPLAMPVPSRHARSPSPISCLSLPCLALSAVQGGAHVPHVGRGRRRITAVRTTPPVAQYLLPSFCECPARFLYPSQLQGVPGYFCVGL